MRRALFTKCDEEKKKKKKLSLSDSDLLVLLKSRRVRRGSRAILLVQVSKNGGVH